jgi:hypothetical protein
MRAEGRLVRRNGIEMFGRDRWYWAAELAGREGAYVEPRSDPKELGKILIYTGQGFLREAKNQESLEVHATLEQFQACRCMQRVQRETVMANLNLMRTAATDISLLRLTTKPEGPAPFTRKRLKGQIQEPAGQTPLTTSVALSQGSTVGKPTRIHSPTQRQVPLQ